MTGLERNADVVMMHCYAPLFVNVNPGAMQWTSDLIGYDTSTSYGSPSYYTQVMFSSCLGDHTLNSAVSGAGDTTSRVQDWNEPMWQALAGNSNYPPAPGAEAASSSFWYLEDPALGHDVWNTYRDFSTSAPLPMYNWLFSQVH